MDRNDDDYIPQRFEELKRQMLADAEMVMRGVFGAEGCLQSDIDQIKDLAQMRKEKLLRDDDNG